MTQLIEAYFTILLKQFQFDIAIYTEHMWMYWCLCIPVFFYTMFFLAKWAVLTAPMWMPFSMVFKGFPMKFYWNKEKKA